MPQQYSKKFQRPVAIDRFFWRQIDDLTVAMKNLVERSSPEKVRTISGWHPFLMVATRATQAIYGSVCYLSADTPDDPLRKLEYGICTSPLIRSLADLLFNIIFIREKVRSRIKRYHRAGWRETKEMLESLEKEYGRNTTWKGKLAKLNASLEDLRVAYRISRRASRKLKSLPTWPIPSKMLREETFLARTKRFLEHLTLWYRELSQDHHMSGGGIIRVYGKLLLEPTDNIRDKTLKDLKTSNVMLAIALVLAISTEVNDIGGFDRGERLAYLWSILTKNRPEARELFNLRYRTMLRKNKMVI
jgi:hypothetical protein